MACGPVFAKADQSAERGASHGRREARLARGKFKLSEDAPRRRQTALRGPERGPSQFIGGRLLLQLKHEQKITSFLEANSKRIVTCKFLVFFCSFLYFKPESPEPYPPTRAHHCSREPPDDPARHACLKGFSRFSRNWKQRRSGRVAFPPPVAVLGGGARRRCFTGAVPPLKPFDLHRERC